MPWGFEADDPTLAIGSPPTVRDPARGEAPLGPYP